MKGLNSKGIETTINSKKFKRVDAIDFTKGVLVILMVVYHSLNYHGIFPYRYIPFVAPGFVMITGFIVTQLYFPKYGKNIGQLRKRLFERSIKLLLIFTILNLISRTLWPTHNLGILFDIERFFRDWKSIYFVGSIRGIAFDVLLPISYVLIICALVPRIVSIEKYFIIFFAISFFTVSIILGSYSNSTYIGSMVSVGVIGTAVGLINLQNYHQYLKLWRVILFFIFLYCACEFLLGEKYVQVPLTMGALIIFYSIGLNVNPKFYINQKILLVGQYSLLSYIAQIAYLKIIFSFFVKTNIKYQNLILTIFIITFLTYLTILITHIFRKQNLKFNNLYKKIFA